MAQALAFALLAVVVIAPIIRIIAREVLAHERQVLCKAAMRLQAFLQMRT